VRGILRQGPERAGCQRPPDLQGLQGQDSLELGCGQGRDTWFFVKNGFEVTALDYSEAGIFQMKEKANEAKAKFSLRVHDARDRLPFPDTMFDGVYSHMFFTMEFSEEEIAKMLAECLRVLRPGGINIYSVRNEHDPHYGKFVPKGKDMWQNPMGFVVRFFHEEKIRRLAGVHSTLDQGVLGPFAPLRQEAVRGRPLETQ
jgi:ubiquinone/menaquinone biosynthesis C-methylase UbiE